MMALRRAYNPIKMFSVCLGFCSSTDPLFFSRSRALYARTFQTSYPNTQIKGHNLYDKAMAGDSHMAISDKCTCLKSSHCCVHGYSKFSLGWCGFSSQADSKSSTIVEDDLDDGFSDLEAEPELSEEEKDAGEGTKEAQEELVSDTEELVPEKKSPKKKISLALLNVIMEAPGRSVKSALDKWVEDGKEFNQAEILVAMFQLRKRNMYGRALQFSEWLESSKKIEFDERTYASRLDLIAKVSGLQVAESYIDKIPESFRTEVIYRTLLANCVGSTNIKKAEAVFKKMKDLGFPLSSFTCNQLLLLYKKTDRRKIADVLLLMEKENVKPSLFTYRILIDVKGHAKDISGMEQIVEAMKAEEIEPDVSVKAILAKHYVSSGLTEKAESVLKDIEGDDANDRKWVCEAVLPLYASLGKADEVARVWESCKSYPRLEDCTSAIFAWGKLGKIEEAEEAFERMTKITKKLGAKHYSALLRVYANHKMVTKGKELVKRMEENGTLVGPLTWDDLVKLYVQAGDVEKADSILQKATQQHGQMKPLFSSYMTIMTQYAKKGDIHNTEKIFLKLKQAGYMGQVKQFETLIRAYVNAKVPAYGIRERMKADNLFPNSEILAMLGKVDAFRKTTVSNLLD